MNIPNMVDTIKIVKQVVKKHKIDFGMYQENFITYCDFTLLGYNYREIPLITCLDGFREAYTQIKPELVELIFFR
jgi:hypothetical protein